MKVGPQTIAWQETEGGFFPTNPRKGFPKFILIAYGRVICSSLTESRRQLQFGYKESVGCSETFPTLYSFRSEIAFAKSIYSIIDIFKAFSQNLFSKMDVMYLVL